NSYYRKMKIKSKILVILGTTASGKSDLAVRFAKKFNGEIISADSRQVYTGLDIGTGKITKKEMDGIPHHMLDVISPKKIFSVAEWKEKSQKIIRQIISRGKLPIICGGTGLYIQSIVDNIVLPEVPPNYPLRKKLEKKSVKELFAILKKLDPRRSKNIEKQNPVRLIRAIEIAKAIGKVPNLKKQKSEFDILQIGLTSKDLKKKIHTRLISRLKKGMIAEAKNLHANGLSWKRMRQLGLEYRYLADFLQNKISKKEFIQKLETEIWRYSRRQITWFKRDSRIKLFEPDQKIKIEKTVDNLLT